MKLFKKLMSAMLAGVLAVGMLAGCSGGSGSVNGPVPTSPRPEDPAVQAVYEVIEQKTAKMNFVSAPAYSKEASALAEGCTYKGQMIFRDPDSVTKESFDNYKSTVSRIDSQYVGAATFSACGWTYTIVVVY